MRIAQPVDSSDSGVDSRLLMDDMSPALVVVEGEHLTQAEYQREWLLKAQMRADEDRQRIRQARRDYETQCAQLSLAVQAMSIAHTANMLNGFVGALRRRK